MGVVFNPVFSTASVTASALSSCKPRCYSISAQAISVWDGGPCGFRHLAHLEGFQRKLGLISHYQGMQIGNGIDDLPGQDGEPVDCRGVTPSLSEALKEGLPVSPGGPFSVTIVVERRCASAGMIPDKQSKRTGEGCRERHAGVPRLIRSFMAEREVAKMYGVSERSLWRNLRWALELAEIVSPLAKAAD